MSRKGEMQQPYGASNSTEGERRRSVASIAKLTATSEDRMRAIDAAMKESPLEIAEQFKTLRRRLWTGTVCVIIATVAPLKLLP